MADELEATPIHLIRRRNILVVGKSQVGKSHLCNILCGRKGVFEEGSRIVSCTLDPHAETFQILNTKDDIYYEVTLVDTPGMFDSRTREDNEKLMGKIIDFIKYSTEVIHRVFCVFRLGPVTAEEIKCIELFRNLFSDDALTAGICSMVVTHCDCMTDDERRAVVSDIVEKSNFQSLVHMFSKDYLTVPKTPEIIPVDFSHGSQTLSKDRAMLMKSIGEAKVPMHKTKLYRLYSTMQEAEERKKMRQALVANILAELKQEKDGKSICPLQ